MCLAVARLEHSDPDTSSVRAGGTRDRRWAAALTIAGLVASVAMAARSHGVHHDDDLTHWQIAHWAWQFPAYLLDDWGRPGFTLLYAPAARLGWLPARLFSGLLTALTAWLAYRVAVWQQVRGAVLVPALLWLQPLTFTLSYTTLTETALAFYLTLATWLYLKRRFGWSAAVVSLAAVTRHEATLFLILWLVALLCRRRPAHEWLWLAWAPLLHNVLSAIWLHKLPLRLFADAHPTAEYGSGTWLTMFTRWPVAAGIGPLMLAWIGMPELRRRAGGTLWVGGGLVYFLAHVVMYRFGLFGSGGYFRFLVPLGPLVAVAAAEGLAQILAMRHAAPGPVECVATTNAAPPPARNRALLIMPASAALLWSATEIEMARYWPMIVRHHLEWTQTALRAGGAVLVAVGTFAALQRRGSLTPITQAARRASPALLVFLTLCQPVAVTMIPPPFRQCAPLVLADRERAHLAAVDWLKARGLASRRMLAPSPWFDLFLNRERPPDAPGAREQLPRLQPGDLVLWDSREAASPRHGLNRVSLSRNEDFVELWHSGGGPYDDVYCAILEKRAPPETGPPRDD